MARETRSVRIAARRHAHPVALARVARRTRRQAYMRCMVKLGPKTRDRREGLEFGRIRPRVTS